VLTKPKVQESDYSGRDVAIDEKEINTGTAVPDQPIGWRIRSLRRQWKII